MREVAKGLFHISNALQTTLTKSGLGKRFLGASFFGGEGGDSSTTMDDTKKKPSGPMLKTTVGVARERERVQAEIVKQERDYQIYRATEYREEETCSQYMQPKAACFIIGIE